MRQRIIGLERVSTSMTLRETKAGCDCIVDGTQSDAVAALCAQGAVGASSLGEPSARLTRLRAVWLMVSTEVDAPTQNRPTGQGLR